jgi:hypothetical protein
MSIEENEPKIETICRFLEVANQLRITLLSTQVLLWGAVMSQKGKVMLSPEMLTKAQLNCDNYRVSEDAEGNITIEATEYCSNCSSSTH